MDLSAPLVRSRHALERSSSDSIVVLDAYSAAGPTTLSGTAARILQAFAQPTITTDLVDLLAADYGVPSSQIRAPVEAFVRELFDAGLVTRP